MTNYAPPMSPTNTMRKKSTKMLWQKIANEFSRKNVNRQAWAIVIIHTRLIFTQAKELREIKTPT